MSKLSPVIQRVSPLADVAVQGRFGADKGAPGVTLSMRHPMSIVTVIARKGQSAALSKALEAAYQCRCPVLVKAPAQTPSPSIGAAPINISPLPKARRKASSIAN
jgi:hypothetical protein